MLNEDSFGIIEKESDMSEWVPMLEKQDKINKEAK